MKAGFISVPTSTLLTPSEVIYLAKDSRASVLVTDLLTWRDLIPMIDQLECLKTIYISGEFEPFD
jgi:acyl-coenzyme A synthetase/AMP-(fatty) acid ligase